MKDLDNRKFVELLRMMAGQDAGGCGEVLREAYQRIEVLQGERDALAEELCKSKGLGGSGRVWVAPCNMGATLYMIVAKRKRVCDPEFYFIKTTYLTPNNFFRVMRDFGKTVFLTKEEADVKLRKIKEQGQG